MVVAADLSIVDNISALKTVSAKVTRIPKRIFLIDRKGRLAVVQAYALGATDVLINPVNQASCWRSWPMTRSRDPGSETMSSGQEPRPPVRPASRRCFRP